MVRKLSGPIRHWKDQSEFRMVLHYNIKTIMRNGYEFPRKKMKTSHLFLVGHLGRYLCCFYRTFTFFIRYDNVTLIPLVLQLGLRIGPIQRMGAN
jgi:hypothetical protein